MEARAVEATAATRYSTVAIILHWLIGLLLIFEVGLGLRLDGEAGPAKYAVFQLHKSVGITILLLVALRLVWRFHRTPPPLATTGWERILATLVHVLFYVLLLALPLSGWIIVSTSKTVVPTLLFGTVAWPHFPGLDNLAAGARVAWNATSEFVHVNLVTLLYILFGLHVAGALKHHFLDRDGDIARMAPGVRPGSWNDPRLLAIVLGIALAGGLGLAWLPIGTVKPAREVTDQSSVGLPMPMPMPTQSDQAPGPSTATIDAPAIAAEPLEEKLPLSTWRIEKRSSLRFRTSWSGEVITGGFKSFDGKIEFSPDMLKESRVEIRIETGSIFSGDDQRDDTLRSADWFAVGSHGAATFKADRFRKVGTDRFVAVGTLTLKAVTLPINLPFTLSIVGDQATMEGTASVDRTAFKIGEGEYASTAEIPAAVSVSVKLSATRQR
jgi:cytochrome b561/polyisoprenoid-binding protein YceI